MHPNLRWQLRWWAFQTAMRAVAYRCHDKRLARAHVLSQLHNFSSETIGTVTFIARCKWNWLIEPPSIRRERAAE